MAEVSEVDKKLVITREGAEVEVYLFGATVTKFKTSSGKEAIWLSTCAKLDGTKAIRGGIPLVFPQFGQPITEMAQHGFARNNIWTVKEKTDKGVVLTLDNKVATHDAWKYEYELTFTIEVGSDSLDTTLSIKNPTAEAFTFQCLQHTYLDVKDIAKTTISGLNGGRFLDKASADPAAMVISTDSEMTIDKFTDRVFVGGNLGDGKKSVVSVKGEGISFVVEGEATLDSTTIPSDVVVWNPWDEKAKGMADFDDEGYKKMLCIEPGLVSAFHTLPAGKTMALIQRLKVS
jgi:glucose-6-phosphate 1-epimerase